MVFRFRFICLKDTMMFDFEKNPMIATCLQDAYEAVTELNMWDYLRDNHFESFNFYHGPNRELHAKLYALVDKRNIHSGVSYGITMRDMESIAKVGFENWKRKYIATHK